MSRSILTSEKKCIVCGSSRNIEMHHIFPSGLRSKSDKYGLIVPLCWEHHQGSKGVHANRKLMDEVKEMGQKAFEEIYGHERFMREFHRNYLPSSEDGVDDGKLDL